MEIVFDNLGDSTLKYPGRVVLNNRTITIFAGDNYDSVFKSFDLPFIKLVQVKENTDSCFQI